MLVRHFKNHSQTPQKYVRLKLPTFANGGDTQLIPLEIVGERAKLLATFAQVEHTPVYRCVCCDSHLAFETYSARVETSGHSYYLHFCQRSC